jgi:hypothetical protein
MDSMPPPPKQEDSLCQNLQRDVDDDAGTCLSRFDASFRKHPRRDHFTADLRHRV